MPKPLKFIDFPEYKRFRVPVKSCSIAPYYPMPRLRSGTKELILDQLKAGRRPLNMFAIVQDGEAQIILGGYQLDILKELPGYEEIEVLIAKQGNFTKTDIARIMTSRQIVGFEDNVIFRSESLAALKTWFHFTNKELGIAIGSNASTVSKLISLMDLTGEVRQAIEAGTLPYTIGRELIGIPESLQNVLLKEYLVQRPPVKRFLNGVARLTGKQNSLTSASQKIQQEPDLIKKSADTVRLENSISEQVGFPCDIQGSKGGIGQLSFRPMSLDGVAQIAELIPHEVLEQDCRIVLEFKNNEALENILASLIKTEEW